MSETTNIPNPVSNAEVVSEITKDLEKSLNLEESRPDEFIINPGSSSNSPENASETEKQKVHASGDHTKTQLGTDNDADLDNEEDHHSESDNDSIDESVLKDMEMSLTEDEKAEKNIIADTLKNVGNDAFKIGDYELSIEKYTDALKTCPLQNIKLRSILYCNRSAAKMKLEKYAAAIKDCSKSIELDDTYIKAYIRRAQSYESTDKLDESLADYKKILELDPSHSEAKKALIRLPPLIEERNAKLKDEMMGKLKDLGNLILKPFGLSTANFQLNQDPESKGYTVNFKQ